MAKPVKFSLKGEGVIEVSKGNKKEYMKALSSGEDIIKVALYAASGIHGFPIMRKQLKSNDPGFMVSGGFEVERIGDSSKYKIRIDGVVSYYGLKKKDLEAISAGTVTCTLDNVGTRDNWFFEGEGACDQILEVAPVV